MRIIKPPSNIEHIDMGIRLFLGGTIDMGNSRDWQTEVEKHFIKVKNLTIFNPRRSDWDSSWPQDPTPGTKFHEQVEWEMKAQNRSSHILYNFEPKSLSPITLLELGLFAKETSKIVIVVCPKEFWRYGNVKYICDLYRIIHFETLNKALRCLDEEFESLQ